MRSDGAKHDCFRAAFDQLRRALPARGPSPWGQTAPDAGSAGLSEAWEAGGMLDAGCRAGPLPAGAVPARLGAVSSRRQAGSGQHAGTAVCRVPRGQPGDDSSVLLGISAAGTPRVAADGAALRPVLDGCRPMGALGAQEEGRTDTPGVPQPTPPAPGTQPLALTAGPTPAPGAPREATAAAGKRRPVRAQRGPSHHGAATRSAAPRAAPRRAVPCRAVRAGGAGGAGGAGRSGGSGPRRCWRRRARCWSRC